MNEIEKALNEVRRAMQILGAESYKNGWVDGVEFTKKKYHLESKPSSPPVSFQGSNGPPPVLESEGGEPL